MKTNKKIALAAATFGIAALAMGGSTFAWFQVVNTANLAIEGTIVGVDDRLEVGFRVTDEILDAEATYGLIRDTGLESGDYVYWAPNTVTPTVMAAIIDASGFNAANELKPITSGSFEAGVSSILPFYSRPDFSSNRTNREYPLVADVATTDYVGFTIIFRALDENDDPVAGQEIYFDEGISLNASDSATGALRVGFDNGTLEDIIKPDAAAVGDIDVGGLMDLNGDGVYDYTLQEYVAGVPQPVYEIAYGEFDESVDPLAWAATATTPGAIAEPYSNDLFYTGATGEGVNALTTYTPKVAEYNTFAAYKDGGTPLGVTAAVTGLIEIDFMVWLEGWDHAAVNSVAEATLGATFAFIGLEP